MQHNTYRLAYNNSTAPVFRWVLGVHVAMVVAFVVSGWIQEWLKPTLVVIPVSMIEISDDLGDGGAVNAASESAPPESATESVSRQRLRTPEEIRRDALRPVQRQVAPRRESPQRNRTVAPIDADSIAERLTQSVKNMNVTIKLPAGAASTVSANELQRYLSAISQVLHQAWDQPTSASVPANQRVSRVRLVVTGEGRIVNAALAESSGSSVMDRSVLAIFDHQDQLPAPRRYGIAESRFTVTIAFTLD